MWSGFVTDLWAKATGACELPPRHSPPDAVHCEAIRTFRWAGDGRVGALACARRNVTDQRATQLLRRQREEEGEEVVVGHQEEHHGANDSQEPLLVCLEAEPFQVGPGLGLGTLAPPPRARARARARHTSSSSYGYG